VNRLQELLEDWKNLAREARILTVAGMRKAYLIETGHREQEACRRLVQMPFLAEGIFRGLGLQASFSWFLLEVRKDRLVPGLHGDVDILAGSLCWPDQKQFEALVSEERRKAEVGRHDSWNYQFAALRLARSGGVMWPPSTKRLVGLEAKCAYLDAGDRRISSNALRSSKSSAGKMAKVRRQVEGLLTLGLDRVALLDIIANPPVSGPDGGAWISSLAVATESAAAMSSILDRRLSEKSEAGHWVWSSGAVVGGYEFQRGAGCPQELRPSKGNIRLENSGAVRAIRQEVERSLGMIFGQFVTPLVFPAIFVDCKNCGSV
jgi:hypothetical protein